MTRFLLAIFLLAGCVLAEAKGNTLWFVFLVRGSARADPAHVDEMQAAHIANFKKLFAEHKLLTAGPLQDPTEFRRGIVVLRVPNAEAVRQCFNTDPYVQAGVMHLEVYRWDANPKGINIKTIDPDAIEENRIVLLTGPEKPDDRAKWPHVAKRCAGKVGGALHGQGEIKEVRLFHGKDQQEAIEKALATDPAVKKGQVRFKVMPLWMAKGALS